MRRVMRMRTIGIHGLLGPLELGLARGEGSRRHGIVGRVVGAGLGSIHPRACLLEVLLGRGRAQHFGVQLLRGRELEDCRSTDSLGCRRVVRGNQRMRDGNYAGLRCQATVARGADTEIGLKPAGTGPLGMWFQYEDR